MTMTNLSINKGERMKKLTALFISILICFGMTACSNNKDTIKLTNELKKSVISAYLYDRETINNFDDELKYARVKAQSDSAVWKPFEKQLSDPNSIYFPAKRKNAIRRIQIKDITLSDKGNTAIVTLRAKLDEWGVTSYVKDYKITISYDFMEQLSLSADTLKLNPLAFMVTSYQTEILKVLEEMEDEQERYKKTKETLKGVFERIEKMEKEGIAPIITNKGEEK